MVRVNHPFVAAAFIAGVSSPPVNGGATKKHGVEKLFPSFVDDEAFMKDYLRK